VRSGTVDALSLVMQIIRRVLILSSLALALSGGAAFADRYRGGGARGGGYVSHPVASRGYSAPRSSGYGYRGGYAVRGGFGVRSGYDRRPIYMRGPVMREHYYNYYRRPAYITESYAAMDGYVWVRGDWTWDGAEWIWQPGHYQPAY
jgi:hypothetical protein